MTEKIPTSDVFLHPKPVDPGPLYLNALQPCCIVFSKYSYSAIASAAAAAGSLSICDQFCKMEKQKDELPKKEYAKRKKRLRLLKQIRQKILL